MMTVKCGAVLEVARLQSMTTTQLRATFLQVFGTKPATNNRSYLLSRVSLRVQEPGVAAALERGSKTMPGPAASPGPLRDPRLPGVGTVLTKSYKGRDLKVLVGDKGFTFDGEKFRSLSAIARRVTGTPWNGFLFFGLIPGESS